MTVKRSQPAGRANPGRTGQAAPLIGVVMGSNNDWDVMSHAVALLAEFGVAHEFQVLSAHRMPDEMFAYAEGAAARGLQAIIAGAGETPRRLPRAPDQGGAGDGAAAQRRSSAAIEARIEEAASQAGESVSAARLRIALAVRW